MDGLPQPLVQDATFQALLRQEGVTVTRQNEAVHVLFNLLVEKRMRQNVVRALIASKSSDQPMTGGAISK